MPEKEQIASTWWEWSKLAIPMLVLAAATFFVTWQFVEPAPPDRVVIATGTASGRYAELGHLYAQRFAEAGIELVVKETAGSVENYQLLLESGSGVDAAIVQGGTAPPGVEAGVMIAVASIYLEPLWLFHRLDDEVRQIRQLVGRRIAVGAEGSGTRALALRLAEANGIADAGDTTLLDVDGPAAVAALRADEVDAAFFVISPEVPYIVEMLADPTLKLVHFGRAEAYSRRFRYLRRVMLPQGALDLAENLPRRDVDLLAATAAIVVRSDTHPSVVQLLVRAAEHTHQKGDLLAEPGQFPSAFGTEIPVSDQADFFLRTPPNVLHRNLPFVVASLIDRLIILIIPLMVVLLPLMRAMPPVYRWRIRRRIYRWYARLRRIDEHLRSGLTARQAAKDMASLASLEQEIAALRVPLSYMQEFYHLRLHLGYMRGRLAASVREAGRGAPNPPHAAKASRPAAGDKQP